ncbi:MAG TPA: hypothetical protein VF063_01515 [Gaiellaceae bacterium]
MILQLSGEEFRNAVLANASPLSHQRDLSEDARKRIADVVRAAWPEGGVRANVEWDESEIRFANAEALAWLTLAPALDIAPSTEQWADLATSGVILTDGSTWLERHYSEQGALEAASSCVSSSLRPWAQLVGAIPNDVRVPDAVVDALMVNVSNMTPRQAQIDLWTVGDRFAREGRLDALRILSKKGSAFEQGLRPWRARLGDSEAARLLLEELIATLRDGKQVDRDEAEWLEGVTDEALLGALFEALALALPLENGSPFGAAGSIGRAIYRIGGDEAVQRYDELIESSDESRFKFLRLQRDEIVQKELRVVGQRDAAEVASRLKLTKLDPGLPRD